VRHKPEVVEDWSGEHDDDETESRAVSDHTSRPSRRNITKMRETINNFSRPEVRPGLGLGNVKASFSLIIIGRFDCQMVEMHSDEQDEQAEEEE